MAKVEDLLDRHRKMVAHRSEWDDWFQSLGEVFLPNKADFTTKTPKGQRRDFKNYENTHRVAARNFATTVDGLLKPKSTRWFNLTVNNDELLEDDDVKLWLDVVVDRMWRAIYSTQSRFVQASSEVDYSLIVFGTGCLWIGENARRDGLMFKSFHMKDVTVGEDASGQIDTLGLTTRLTKRQAEQRFGAANLGEKLKEERASEGMSEKKFEFVQLILPRTDRDSSKINSRNMPFASVVIDVESEHIVSESGFNEFPAAVPRWDTAPDEVYGRSPAMHAYADTRTLQAIARTMLIAGQRAADPTTWILNDAVLSPVKTMPGGVIVLDAQSVHQNGGRAPLGTLDMGKNMPLGREMQLDYRDLVQKAFFNDLFINSVENRNLTATEVLERKEELVRVLGPTFGRLEGDYIGVVIERVFRIMDRAGAFPPRPQALEDAQIAFTYMSPIQQARKTTEAAGLSRAFDMLLPVAQTHPGAAAMLDNFDWDTIARDTPDWAGFPQKYMKPMGQVDDDRQQRAQQEQEAAALQQAQVAGATTRDFALAEQAGAAAEAQAAG